MNLPAKHKAAFMRSQYHAVYVIGPPHRVHLQSDAQHATMWDWIATGIGHNGPPEPIDLAMSVWPQRLIVSHDLSSKVLQRVDDEQCGFTCGVQGRVWCKTRAHAAILKAHYRTFKGADLRKQWIDGGTPIARPDMDYELICIAKDHGIVALADDGLLDALDDIVWKPRRREQHATGN
jgi:hypothetical protein